MASPQQPTLPSSTQRQGGETYLPMAGAPALQRLYPPDGDHPSRAVSDGMEGQPVSRWPVHAQHEGSGLPAVRSCIGDGHTEGPRGPCGPNELTKRGHEFKEAPMSSCTGSRISIRPECGHAQGLGIQRRPSALTHKGQAFIEAPVRSHTRAVNSRIPGALMRSVQELNRGPVCSRPGSGISLNPLCGQAPAP